MATQAKKSAFERLSAVNVSEKVERKGQLSYLSWAHAWAFAKKLYPNLFSYSLKSLSTLFKIREGDHRALNDAKCLQKVYHNLLLKLTNKIDKTYDSLIENPSIVYDYIYN